MKSRLLILAGVVVLGVVLAAVWFLNAPLPQPAVAPVTPMVAPTGPVATTTTPPPPAPSRVTKVRPEQPRAIQPEQTAPPPLADWEVKISQVLESNSGETETAQMLINLLPTLPVDGQTEAAQHITNLITDKDYGRVLPLLRNASLPQEVQDVLVTDLMNRDDPVKLPALLDVARNANHPYHEEALSDLQIFLDEDNETNWAKWDTAVKTYLKKQALEQAGEEVPEPEPAPEKP